jgi:hypothetical protein
MATLSDGVTVDANVMAGFTKSLISETSTDAYKIVERIKAGQGFAIDVGDLIKTQWFETCGRAVFGQWFVSQLQTGRIRMVTPLLANNHKRCLRKDCGMPMRGEVIYVSVAAATTIRYIVTEDIDFWEPSAKRRDEKSKARIRTRREGAVCRYLSKYLEIRIGTPAMALGDLQ